MLTAQAYVVSLYFGVLSNKSSINRTLSLLSYFMTDD